MHCFLCRGWYNYEQVEAPTFFPKEGTMKILNILATLAFVCAAVLCPNGLAAEERMTEAELITKRGHNFKIVPFSTEYERDTIVIVSNERTLYVVNGDGTAVRFKIAVGREGFDWSGEAYINHKTKCPEWNPPEAMIGRKPELAQWVDGMPGCIPINPLGAHALYLFDLDGQDTLTRIHGTDKPETIGTADTSGCFRMYNSHVAWVFARITGQPSVFVIANLPFEEGMSEAEMAGIDESDVKGDYGDEAAMNDDESVIEPAWAEIDEDDYGDYE